MNPVGIGVRLGIGGALLGALAAQTAAPCGAQVPASGQELIERLRQIQGQIGRDAAAPPQDPAAPGQQAAGQDAGAAAPPALGAEEVRTMMRTNLGVEVLDVELVESEGRPAYAVTVMHPPGNSNDAFLVETLLVDGATGGLLGRLPQRPRVASGTAEPSGQADFDGDGREIRRRSHR